jgi:hypothetical protein
MTKSVSKRTFKNIQMTIVAKNIELQAYFKELSQQVGSFSKVGCLDTKIIAVIKTWLAS